jgi:hypothetical protein
LQIIVYQNTKFYGIDNKLRRIEKSKQYQFDNIEWIIGNINNLENFPFLSQADGIFMRYFVLHLPNIREFF